MISVSAGTDTYGKVKQVAGTSIVTKFAMLQSMPIYPVQSYYHLGQDSTQHAGLPFVASTSTVNVNGIPLARFDLASIAIAYLRGICAALFVFGFMGTLVPAIMLMTGEHIDDLGRLIFRVLCTSLAIGILGGSLTYVLPLTTRRERDIRKFCGELLGAGIDPARFHASYLRTFEQQVAQIDSMLAFDDAERERYFSRLRELVALRTQIAKGEDAKRAEGQTDELLSQLRHGVGFKG